MSNVLYNQKFRCSRCKEEVKVYVWTKDLEEGKLPVHEKCGKTLKIVEEPQTNESFSIGGKFKKGRNPIDARKRSTDHFKKEILPYLGRDEKRHFRKKGIRPS